MVHQEQVQVVVAVAVVQKVQLDQVVPVPQTVPVVQAHLQEQVERMVLLVLTDQKVVAAKVEKLVPAVVVAKMEAVVQAEVVVC